MKQKNESKVKLMKTGLETWSGLLDNIFKLCTAFIFVLSALGVGLWILIVLVKSAME